MVWLDFDTDTENLRCTPLRGRGNTKKERILEKKKVVKRLDSRGVILSRKGNCRRLWRGRETTLHAVR